MRQQAQLNLGVVAGEKNAALGNGKGSTDTMSQLRASRNVLQVWIRAGKPSCCSNGLIECGVDALIATNKRRKRIEIS